MAHGRFITGVAYHPSYRLPVEATQEDHDACEYDQEQGPRTLDEVIETCRFTGAKAMLYDADGHLLGRVFPDGSYRLGR